MTSSPQQRPGRLRVGVVGAGRVGAVLGAALGAAGHRVVATAAVSRASRCRAAELLPAAALRPADEVAAGADLLLLAVPDDALPGLVEGLVGTGAIRRGQLVLHTSGVHGLGVLDPARRIGALPLATHPAMLFTGTAEDLRRLAGCAFGVTAPEPLEPVAAALVVEMGGEPMLVPDSARAAYHAALVHGADHLATLVADATDLLARAGVADPARLLGPLLAGVLDLAVRRGDAAQRGPASRGDAAVVAAHLEQLTERLPDAVAGYVALARRTADRALDGGRLDPARAADLLDVLATERLRAQP